MAMHQAGHRALARQGKASACGTNGCSRSFRNVRAVQASSSLQVAYTTAVAAPAEVQTAASAGRLVCSRVVKNRKGLFRIRHVQTSDLYDVAQLQAAAFHESPPLKAFDQLAFTMFKAEVLSAVQKKTKVLADDGFAIMVVESCSPGFNAMEASSSSSDSENEDCSSGSDWDAAVWYGDQQAAAVAGAQHTQHSADTASAVLKPSKVLGVIEVGVQDERDVLQHLPPGMETYAYISSMAVAPGLRRCGMGAALLQAAEQQAVIWGQPLVALHVYASNDRAIRLYQRHGMRCHNKDPAWKSLVGGKVRHLMVKDV